MIDAGPNPWECGASPMTIRILRWALAAASALLWALAVAEEPRTIPRIGVLVPSMADSPFEEGLREGLRDLGYVEPKDLILDWRRSPETPEAVRLLAAGLMKSNVELIVAIGSPATRAVLEANTTTPVVFTSGDPVAAGFASSLARPGRNGTGVSIVSLPLNQKCLEFLHELAPRARRILYLMNTSSPLGAQDRDAVQAAAQSLGVQIITLNARNLGELDTALRALPRSGGQAFLMSGNFFLLTHRADIVRAVRAAKLPAMFPYSEYHDLDVLVSYGTNLKQVMHRVAGYVDKILKGAKPADLPVEQLSNHELVINLRLAHELGLDVPQTLLLRADRVVR